MAKPQEFEIPPDNIDDFLKTNTSVSGAVYEANKEQFEKAVHLGKIEITQQPNSAQITVGKKLTSTSYTYRWKWKGSIE